MAEGELNYASIRFKANKVFPEGNKEEETVYNEVKVQSKTTEKTADTIDKKGEQTVYDNVKEQNKTTKQTADMNLSAGLFPVKKTKSRGRRYQQVACCLGILCVILLLGIIGFCVYISTLIHESEQNQLKENQTLLALIRNLTNLNNQFNSENENLRRDHNNLTVQLNNLTQDYTVLKSQMTNLSAENQNLTSQNDHLSAENQNLTSQNKKLSAENQNLTSKNINLESQRNNLTEQIRNMETKWNELNVSRAQWSIDAYCPKQNQNRECKACQPGWLPSQSGCYAINDAGVSDQKTWEEAREDCRGKISDLVVIVDQTEKTFISNNSWSSSGTKGYWIGLKAENEKWKWVDGSDLTESSWIQEPATNRQCVISVQNEGWKSVSCGAKNRWICKKKGLSV